MSQKSITEGIKIHNCVTTDRVYIYTEPNGGGRIEFDTMDEAKEYISTHKSQIMLSSSIPLLQSLAVQIEDDIRSCIESSTLFCGYSKKDIDTLVKISTDIDYDRHIVVVDICLRAHPFISDLMIDDLDLVIRMYDQDAHLTLDADPRQLHTDIHVGWISYISTFNLFVSKDNLILFIY